MNIMNKISKYLNFVLSKYTYASIFVFYSFFKTFKYFVRYKFPTYLMILYGLLILLYKLTDARNKFGTISEILPSLLITLSACISIVASKSFNFDNLKLLLMFLVSLLVLLPEDKNDSDEMIYKKMYQFCLLVAVLFFIYTFISFLYYVIVGNAENRPMGMLNELTYFAQSIVACIGASVYCFIYTRNINIKMFATINFIFQSFVLFLTLQRGSLYGYFIAMIFLSYIAINYFDNTKVRINKNVILVVMVSLVLLFVILSVSGKFNVKLIIDRFTAGLALREYIYKFGFMAMVYHRNYLFGATRGGIYDKWHQYLQVSFEYWKEPYEKYSIVRGCIDEVAIHSTVLEQLFVHGIFGLLSLLYLYFKIVYKVFISVFKKRLTNDQLALVASSLFCLIAVMFDSFFNRALLFDIVYPQNLCFFVFAGALFRLIDSNKMKVVN